ncbi:MAG: aminoacyl-tRNA hydrolase [Pseudomonadota bacterium]
MSAIQLVIGLANPGQSYEKTRHNAGAWWLNYAMGHWRCSWSTQSKLSAQVSQYALPDRVLRLAQPTVYMNESGQSVQALLHYYKITPDQLLVVHDDLDLQPGDVRFKFDGGHGGHNGLRDIIQKVGTAAFYRLRLGIGHPGHRDQVSDYVLNQPSVADRARIDGAIEKSFCAWEGLVTGDLTKAQNALNKSS